jgi:RimJ/RimL family protein N-acetyltransferase
MLNSNPIVLHGHHVILESFNEVHRNELRNAAQDERIWTYIGTNAFGYRFNPWFDTALNNLETMRQIPFIVRRIKDGEIIGSTRFYDIFPEHRRLTIGYTWYTLDAWGSAVNPECKYLLLNHAFEILQMIRVEFLADVRNLRSRAAIKKLGAIEEGILRNHMVLENGFIRDTAIYSIINSDWADVKSQLTNRINTFRTFRT